MRIGIVGLGRMGMNMAERMLKQGQEVVAYNRSQDKVRELATKGAIPPRPRLSLSLSSRLLG